MDTDNCPADYDDPPEVIARYGSLHDNDMSADERVKLLVELLIDLFCRSGLDTRAVRGRITSGPALLATIAGSPFLIEITWSSPGTIQNDVPALRRAAAERPHVRFVLVSMLGFLPETVQAHAAGSNGTLILLDRSHVEAVVYGLVTPEDMLTELAHLSEFENRAWTSLTNLLVGGTVTRPAQLVTPDRLPAPWELLVQASPSVRLRHVFSGDRGWGQPLGFTAADGRLLITLEAGIVQADLTRGTVDWLLQLPGCRGTPLIQADGTVLTLCRDAIVAWKDGVLTPIGGGFPDGRALLTGPGNGPWVLSGYGPTGTLALTRLGDGHGQQHSRPIHFGADIRSAGWLGDLRFYLASAGHSAVVDFARSSRVRREDWIVTPHDRPDHLVVIDQQTVVTASPDPGGVRATVYRTNLGTGTSELLAEIASNRVDGLTRGPVGQLLLLGDVRGNDLGMPYPIVIAIDDAVPEPVGPSATGPTTLNRTPQVASPPAPTVQHDPDPHGDAPVESRARLNPVTEAFRGVSFEARGVRKDYRLDRRPIAPGGGQGTVYGAIHKSTGLRVAFKRLNNGSADQRARMRREVDAAQLFGGHPNVMPVLDFNFAEGWFVMPVASHSAQDVVADLADTTALRELVTAICGALRDPHQLGWIHRDLKPDNILRLEDRWVVADWGLGRRPRGQTTDPHRTQLGGRFGTEGFAAPELSIDAHGVGPQADIYSIGQIIGWAWTNTWPRANVPLLPPPGPWRNFVKAATQANPGDRPATVDQLLAMIAAELDAPPEIPANRGEQLLAALRRGDSGALYRLVELAARHPGDYDLYLEVLVDLDEDQLREAVTAHPSALRDIVRGVPDLHSGAGVTLEYGDVDRLVTWLLVVAYQAEAIEEWDLLEDATAGILYLDLWDRWGVQADIRAWLASRSGHAAAVVAAVIRRNPDNHSHFGELVDDRRVDHRIRSALTPQTQRDP